MVLTLIHGGTQISLNLELARLSIFPKKTNKQKKKTVMTGKKNLDGTGDWNWWLEIIFESSIFFIPYCLQKFNRVQTGFSRKPKPMLVWLFHLSICLARALSVVSCFLILFHNLNKLLGFSLMRLIPLWVR